jgi:glycosyltransferase involved in cell wall biosynthesis
MPNPLVSVVLTVYNAAKYLDDCLKSIDAQTYRRWELIIINDGSTDNSDDIIAEFISMATNKVKYIVLPKNRGVSSSLNLGIRQAKGKYIAKIDADDMMLDTRLEEQVNFLEIHPNISVVGSNAIEIDAQGNEIGLMTVPSDNFMIKKLLFSTYPIIHPSVMMHRTIFTKGIIYRDKYPHSEDLDLWLKLSTRINFANLENPLIKKRTHHEQITMSKYGHYDSMKAKADFFLDNGIFIKNVHYLLKHLFIVIFIPNIFYIFLKRDALRKRKRNHNSFKKMQYALIEEKAKKAVFLE